MAWMPSAVNRATKRARTNSSPRNQALSPSCRLAKVCWANSDEGTRVVGFLVALRNVLPEGRYLGFAQVIRVIRLALATTDTLARPPKGFEDAPATVAETLKLKSWYVEQDLTAAEIGSAALIETLAAFAGKVTPLLQFGWAAID